MNTQGIIDLQHMYDTIGLNADQADHLLKLGGRLNIPTAPKAAITRDVLSPTREVGIVAQLFI
jgi:hypothetical protein